MGKERGEISMARMTPYRCAAFALLAVILTACSTAPRESRAPSDGWIGQPYTVKGVRYQPRAEPNYDAVGIASWYGGKFHGRKTASGQRFDKNALTAAHKTLPFGTRVKVTNLRTKRSVVVTINDRGPFVHGRIVDLSQRAAEAIGLRHTGTGKVRVQVVSSDSG